MAQEGKIGITIDRKIWEKLVKLKIKMQVRTFDDVLENILKSAKAYQNGAPRRGKTA